MDPITHGLAGALIAEAGIKQRLGARATFLLAGAAMFPDIDILYRLEGLPTYIEHHRGFSHSYLGLILSGGFLGAIFGWFDEERRYLPWMSAMWVALFSHQILDLITSYGTVVLYPLSNTRYYLDWVFVLDLFLTGIILIAFILARLQRVRGAFRARKGLLVAASYIAFCALNHTLALHQVKAAADHSNISYTRFAAIPQPLLPIRWSGILDAGLHYYQVPLFSFLQPQSPFQAFPKSTGSYFEQKARASEIGLLYFWFARYPVVEEKVRGSVHIIQFSDLRFYIRLHRFPIRKPFVLHFEIDNSGKILESRFTRL